MTKTKQKKGYTGFGQVAVESLPTVVMTLDYIMC
jgi:hypothetical protein